jgi:hypothetical protein
MSYRMAAQIAARQHRYFGHRALDRGDIPEARRYLERARYMDPNGNHSSLEQRICAAGADAEREDRNA